MVAEKKPALEFTEAAALKLHEVLKEQDAIESYLRIAVSTTPQGGIEYVFGLEEKPAETDEVFEFGHLRAVIDGDSMPLLTGSSIDYVEGFQRTGFVISNPNFRGGGCACGGGGCGCGGASHGGAEDKDAAAMEMEAEAGQGGCACGGGGCGRH